MKTAKEIYGERIESLRRRQGFTQQSLADAMGVDRARVSDWERGVHEPKGDLRQKLLGLLGAKEEDIFGIQGASWGHSENRTELIADIVGALPALNESELRIVLATIQALPNPAISK